MSDKLQTALHRETVLRQTLFKTLAESIIILDVSGRIVDANLSAVTLLQMSLTDLLGQPFEQICRFTHEQSRAPIKHPLQDLLSAASQQPAKCWILETDYRTEIAVHLTACPLALDPPETVVILQDVTTNRNLSRQLQWQAHHDPITGLINRIYFEEILAQVLKQDLQEPPFYVLAQLDLDHFKLINDTCGHVAGDQLLGQLAVLFQDQIRSDDLLARLGGDEFGILFRHCSLVEAHQWVSQMLDALRAFRYVWKGRSLAIGMSIGLVLLDRETPSVEAALSKVDTACYTAKNRGKSRIQVFSSRDVEVEDLKRHQEWSFLIRDAIDEGRLVLYRQPIVEINRVATLPHHAPPHHYEVLLRMVDAEGNTITPNRFIPTAERYHLMPMVDRWVVDHCFRHWEQIIEESSAGADAATVYAINLSGDSLNDDLFLEELMSRVRECRIPPHQICFEITETAAIANLERVDAFMQALKQMGCLFSLDDFGAGMSSFGYLSALPVDFVKIDGKFVQDIEVNASHVTIVESIVHISKSLGLKTIAEQVDSQSTAHRLQALGVDYLQGFGVGRPVRWI